MIIYYIISTLTIVISAILMHEYIIISPGSLMPIAIIAISLFQALTLHSTQNDITSQSYSSSEIDCEAASISLKYHRVMKLIIIPLSLPFVIYFDLVWKIIAPILIYILSYFPVRPLTRREQRRNKPSE